MISPAAIHTVREHLAKPLEPNSRYARVPWLKAAYLSVFSLLGVHGYRYAEGKAIEQVRRQIMKPEDEVIRYFAVKAPAAWQERDGIAMNREQTPCWAVKMGDCIVLLPRSWDKSFYEWTDNLPSSNGKITIGGGPTLVSREVWSPTRSFNRIARGLQSLFCAPHIGLVDLHATAEPFSAAGEQVLYPV